MSDIFVSYAREDREQAGRLALTLQGNGWSVWWDPEILPGEEWDKRIKEQLGRARCVLVLWSSHSVASDWVKAEATEGLERRILVPALIEEGTVPPPSFRSLQAAKLWDWDSERQHTDFDSLLDAIRQIIGEPPWRGPRDFKHDIYISYSHLDNRNVESDVGWVSFLNRMLSVRLAELWGEESRIFFDPQMEGKQLFGEVKERVQRAAVLVPVLSPSYFQSERCMKELRVFSRARSAKYIFKCVKTAIAATRQPPEIQQSLGYDFLKLDSVTGREREINPTVDRDTFTEFYRIVDDLAHDITHAIDELRLPKALPGMATVYLAETSSDLQWYRDTVRRDLQQNGFIVLPDVSLPLDEPTLKSVVREQLELCRLSIHMIGAKYGVIPEDAEVSLILLQYELATERAKEGDLFRLLWMPPGLVVRDRRQQKLIQELQTDPRLGEESDLLVTSLQKLQKTVHQRLGSEL